MEKNFEKRFISPEDYNAKIMNDKKHFNCLAFAFGEYEYYEFFDFMLNDRSYPNIIDAFKDEAHFRRIGIELVDNIESIKGNYGFILFGWVFGYPRKGFHIARVEPDGKIVHKLGVKETAGYTTFEALKCIYKSEPCFYFKFTGEYKN